MTLQELTTKASKSVRQNDSNQLLPALHKQLVITHTTTTPLGVGILDELCQATVELARY